LLRALSGRFKARAVAIDETGFKYMKHRASILFTVDLESRLVVNVRLMVNSRAAYDVMSMVKQLGLGVEYVHGEAHGMGHGAGELSHRRERFERRSIVKQAFRSLNHRIKRFSHFREPN